MPTEWTPDNVARALQSTYATLNPHYRDDAEGDGCLDAIFAVRTFARGIAKGFTVRMTDDDARTGYPMTFQLRIPIADGDGHAAYEVVAHWMRNDPSWHSAWTQTHCAIVDAVASEGCAASK